LLLVKDTEYLKISRH